MDILTIVGPTAAGKTSLAIRLAKRIHGEIISADSRQIYRFMPIGTGQPTKKQRRSTAFHLIDFIDPDTHYSCGQFARDAETAIDDCIARSKVPIVCGGTGLYIRALFDPLHPLPQSDDAIKQKLIHELQHKGLDALYKRLKKCDPQWAEKIGPHDKQRILRGLEIYELTGTPISILTSRKKSAPRYHPHYIGLRLPREVLYERINSRFDKMLECGLVEEVRYLLNKNYDPECNALRSIGYQEIIDYLHNKIPLATAIEKAKQHTRQFAKRQLIWFRKVSPITWFDPRDPDIENHSIRRLHDS